MHLTLNQRLVLNALRQAKRPLGAYALLKQLREEGLNSPTQIYRALSRLVEHRVVHRLDTMNAFVACSHVKDCRHSQVAFVICNTCGDVEEVLDNDLGRSLERWATNHAFTLGGTAVEIRGKCASCANSEQPGDPCRSANENTGSLKHV